ncbi:MAG: class I SAM-dependent methyltransferase [Halobacteriaceae archaeon]
MPVLEPLLKGLLYNWRRILDRYLLPGNEIIYEIDLMLRGAERHPELPKRNAEYAAVLQSESDTEAATAEIGNLGLHSHPMDWKNWDHLRALKTILDETQTNEAVLDAGGGRFSPLVEWLYLYGYHDLNAVNLAFDHSFARGPIDYRAGDLTDTSYGDDYFGAIASLSVLEHGVPMKAAFEEFHRVLEPGGVLVLSTDYWPEKRDTGNEVTNYGDDTQQWEIFDDEELCMMLEIASETGFEVPEWNPTVPEDPPISFGGYDYTFAYAELYLPE